MSSIQNALLSLLDDLRARRLLPVAGLLVAALIAAPLVLSKGSETPTTPPAQPTATPNQNEQKGPEELAQVRLDEKVAEGTGSSLSAFDASNPFAPPEKVIAAARDQAEGGGVGVPTDGTAPTDTGAGDTGGGGGTVPDEGGTTPDDGGGGGTTTTQFTYVVDATLWVNGRKREIKGMEKLDQLPSAAAPLLIFMGATDSGGNAVFLVDSTLQTTGEGKCKPSRAECAFLYLGAGSEQEFTNEDGDSYRLLIKQIRKVKVDDGSTANEDAESAQKTASASTEVRRFVPPVLVDLVIETTDGDGDSTTAPERR